MITDIEKLILPAGLVTARHDLGDGEVLLTFDLDRKNELFDALAGQGFAEKKHFSVGGTDGTFYSDENGMALYVYTNSGVPFARAVVGASLPTEDNDIGEPIYKDALFYQVYTDPKRSGGMTYLVRMKDGRFIIIDGGFNADCEVLLRVMAELHPKADTSVPYEVAAWIVTHPHSDHIETLNRVLADKSVLSRLNIKRLIANLPPSETLLGVDDSVIPDNDRTRDVCFAALCSLGCEIIKPYAGMNIGVGELTMNVFYTQADWRLVEMKTINDASVVFSLTREGGRTVLILGDIMDRVAKHIMEMYTPDQLHAEVVQIAHHALIGPDITLYEAIRPKICFWSINLRGYEYTQYPTITERNDKLREMDVINCIACFGPSQCVI